MVTTNINADSLSILKNNGDGTFAAKVDYPAEDGPFEVFAANLDGDTFPDLAVANAGPSPSSLNSTVSVFMNQGDGTFADTNYETGTGPFSVVAEDLDGDSDLDLIVLNRFADSVSVLKNNGNGTFCCKVDYPTEVGTHKIFSSDLDRDGDKDLIVSNLGPLPDLGGTTVSVFKNNGNGTFAARVNYTTGMSPAWVFAANLDGDTFPDLAVTNFGSFNVPGNTVSILKNNGDGTFATKVDYGTGTGPGPVVASDLEGDGNQDLAVANSNATISVLKNNGDGTFAAKVDYPITNATLPHSLKAADLDGDGDQDLAELNRDLNNIVSVLINLSINQPPVLDPLTPETLYENSFIFFGVQFTDPDVYQASLTAPNLPNNASFDDNGDMTGLFTFSPDTSQAGNYNIIFIASDGILADTDSVAITVLNCGFKAGDVNGDGSYSLPDIISEVNIVFKGAPKPTPACRADANADNSSSLPDIIKLVNKVFKGGPTPPKIGVCCL